MFLQEPEEKRLIFPANYTIIFSVIRRRGETGRRNRLKICRGRPRIGSIPIDGTKTPQEPSLLRGFDVRKIGMENSFDCARGGGAARSGKGGIVFGAVRTAASFHLSPFPAARPKGRRREAHSHISVRRCGRALCKNHMACGILSGVLYRQAAFLRATRINCEQCIQNV